MTVLQFRPRPDKSPGGVSPEEEETWDESFVLRILYKKGKYYGCQLQELPVSGEILHKDHELFGQYLCDIGSSYMYLLEEWNRIHTGVDDDDVNHAFLIGCLTNGVSYVYSYEPFISPEDSQWLLNRLRASHKAILEQHAKDRIVEDNEQLELFPRDLQNV